MRGRGPCCGMRWGSRDHEHGRYDVRSTTAGVVAVTSQRTAQRSRGAQHAEVTCSPGRECSDGGKPALSTDLVCACMHAPGACRVAIMWLACGCTCVGAEGGAYTHERRDVVAGCHDRRLKVLGHHEHHEGGADRVVEHQQVEDALQEVSGADVRRNCSRTAPSQHGRRCLQRAAALPGAHAWCAVRAVAGYAAARRRTDTELHTAAADGRWAGHDKNRVTFGK